MASEATPTALSVNVNKIAILRNSRGGLEPDVLRAARTCLSAGAQGITVHPRPDRRHITAEDVVALAELTTQYQVELNIEGNPFAPPRVGYPGLMDLCQQIRPAQVTLVPDADDQLTSDHGFDFDRDSFRLAPLVRQLKAWDCRVSLFVDAGCTGLPNAVAMGADRVELYTGPYAAGWSAGNPQEALGLFRETSLRAATVGLGVNAGHDLSQDNLGLFLSNVPNVQEVSIGHSLVSEALYDGLEITTRRYLDIIAGVRKI